MIIHKKNRKKPIFQTLYINKDSEMRERFRNNYRNKTHKELKEVNLEKLEGIGPSKELP